MAQAKTSQDGTSASWALLTHLLDLLMAKGVLSDQDLVALAESAHADASAQPTKRGAGRLKKFRDKVKARA
jgi:hypothetical protein